MLLTNGYIIIPQLQDLSVYASYWNEQGQEMLNLLKHSF